MQRKAIETGTVLAFSRDEAFTPDPVLVLSATLHTHTRVHAPDFMGRNETGYLVLRGPWADSREEMIENLHRVAADLPENFTTEDLEKFTENLPQDYRVSVVNNRHLRGSYTAVVQRQKAEREEAFRRHEQAEANRVQQQQENDRKRALIAAELDKRGLNGMVGYINEHGRIEIKASHLMELLGLDDK